MEAAVTSSTKLIILNSPNNPTGCIYTKKVLLELLQICKKYGIMVLADEIYEKLVYSGEKHVSFASLGEWAMANTITVNGFSKAYAMTGWRVGYSAAPADIAKGISSLQGHTTSNANTIAQYAALEALNGPQDYRETMRKTFQQRRDYLAARLAAMPGVQCPKAHGAFYLMPNVAGFFGKATPGGTTIGTAAGLCTYLLEEARVALVPGEAFCSPQNIRISYANSITELAEGANRIEDALSQLR